MELTEEFKAKFKSSILYLTIPQCIVALWWLGFARKRAIKFIDCVNDGMSAEFAFMAAKRRDK